MTSEPENEKIPDLYTESVAKLNYIIEENKALPITVNFNRGDISAKTTENRVASMS